MNVALTSIKRFYPWAVCSSARTTPSKGFVRDSKIVRIRTASG